MQHLLDEQRATGFSSLAGADLTIRLPVSETILNELLLAGVFAPGAKGPLTGVSARIHPDNRFTLNLSIDQWPLPKNVAIDGSLSPTTDFARDPRLLILLAPSGLLGMILKIVLGSMESLRPFLTVSGERVFIDVAVLLTRAGAADFLPLLQTLRLSTVSGVLTIDLNLHIVSEEKL